MFGSDFIHIKDHRGGECGFFWSDVQQFANVFEEDDEWVRVKFRNDPEDTYTMMFNISVKEFLETVKKQLNPQDTRKHTPNPYDFPPPPAYEFLPSRISVVPLSNPYKDGPADRIET